MRPSEKSGASDMIKLVSGDLQKIEAPLLIIPVCEDKNLHDDPVVLDLLKPLARYDEFTGKSGEEFMWFPANHIKAARVLFVGIGKSDKLDLETFRDFAGRAVKRGIKKEFGRMVLCAPSFEKINMPAHSIITALAEGAVLANHVFDRYKKEKKKKLLSDIRVFTDAQTVKTGKPWVKQAEIICQGTILARDWVNTPPNDKRPDQFVRLMHRAAEKENLKITVLDEKELKKNKMGGILAVGAGSQSRPRMMIIDYHPAPETRSAKKAKTIALVGKGVTFDSGGINLKSSGGLADMKMDMAGAAAVAAALITAARLSLGMRVVGVIPVVENMVSGDAVRPGDIIASYSGKSVEIGNTDAEGRLILMDALAYAVRTFKPDAVLDIATLTGACIVALGEKIAGVFSQDQKLSDDIVASGDATHERCWAMPMPEDYKDMLKSDLADMKNVGAARWAGSIVAALFLSEFVGNTRWAHIDIAGPAFAKKDNGYCGPGGTGFGVRLFIDLLQKWQLD